MTRQPTTNRIAALDVARGLALAGMVLFHFVRDLEMFGYLPHGATMTGGWPLFARIVAGSFLCLSGISLVLAAQQPAFGRAFGMRLAKIVSAALLVTGATMAIFPDQYIFFGILHMIATASLLGLLFLRLPVLGILASAVGVALAAEVLAPLPGPRMMIWLGLSGVFPRTLDFLPVFPWFAPALLGIAIGKVGLTHDIWQRLARQVDSRSPGWALICWPGRHSLTIYLLHQPMLFALLWSVSYIT